MGEFVWVRVNETNAENAAFLLEEQEEVFRVKWATVNQEEWLYKDEHTIVKPSGDRGRRARRAPAPAAAPVKKKRVKKETTKKGEDTGTAKEEGASAASKSQPAAKKAAAKTKPSQRASKKQSTKKKETTKKKRAEAAARYESNRTIADAKEAVVAALNKLPATPNKLPTSTQEETSAEEAKPASKREVAADPPAPLASAKEGPVEEEDIETEKDVKGHDEAEAAKNDAAQAAGLATKQPAKKKEPSKKNAKLTSQKEAIASPQSASTTSAPEKTASPISEKPASTKKAGAAKPNAAPVAKALPSKKETLLRKAIAAVLAPLPFPKSASTKQTVISEKPSPNKKDDNSNTPAGGTEKNAVEATAIAQSIKKKTPTRKVRPASKMEVSPASAAAKAKLAKLKASTKQRAQPIDPPATGPTQQQNAASNNNHRPRKRTKRAEPEKSTKKAKKRKAVATTDEEEPPNKKTKSVTAQQEETGKNQAESAKKKQTTGIGEGSNAKQAQPKESMQLEEENKQVGNLDGKSKSSLNEENPVARPSTPAQPNSEQMVGENGSKKGENTAKLKQANSGSTTGLTSLPNLPQDAIVFSCPHCGDDNVTQLKDEFLGKFLRLGVADHRNRRGVEMMDGHRDVEELDSNNEYKEQKDHVLNCLVQRLEAMGQKLKDKSEIPLECIPPLYRDRHLDVQNMQYKKMLKYQRVQYRTVKDQDRNREIERQLRVVYANPDVMKMLGWSHTDFPGGFVPDEVPPYKSLPKGDPK